MDFSAAGGWATFASFALELVLLFWAGARYFTKLSHKLERIEAEQQPNHGSSMRDAINRIEDLVTDIQLDVHRVDNRLAKLEGKFEQHVDENSE